LNQNRQPPRRGRELRQFASANSEPHRCSTRPIPRLPRRRRPDAREAPVRHRHGPLQSHFPRSPRTAPSRRSGRGQIGRLDIRVLARLLLTARVPGRRPRAFGPVASGLHRRGRGSYSQPPARAGRQHRTQRRMPGPSGCPAPRRPNRARRFASATGRYQLPAAGDSDPAG